MAFAPGFAWDIFISYASADNTHGPGLISYFHDHLEKELRADGMPSTEDEVDRVKVYRDTHKIQTGADLSKQLSEAASTSAIFIIFYSRAYLQSKSCTQEFNAFCSSVCHDRIHSARIYVIALGTRALPRYDNRKLISDRLYRRFYYVKTSSDFPFRPEVQHQNENGYTLREEIIQISREIADVLRSFRSPRVNSTATQPQPGMDRNLMLVPDHTELAIKGTVSEDMTAPNPTDQGGQRATEPHQSKLNPADVNDIQTQLLRQSE